MFGTFACNLSLSLLSRVAALAMLAGLACASPAGAQTAHLLGTTSTLGSGFSNPSGVAVDGAGNVYVADTFDSAVEEIPYSGGSYGTPVTLSSSFFFPFGVAVDGAGNVYVADTYDNAVKEIPYSGGSYGTPVTLGSGFSFPNGVAVDGAGNVYVADRGNNAVKEIPYSGGSYGTPVTLGGGFYLPAGVAVDGAGNVYVADSLNNAVKKIPYSGGSYGTPVTLGSGFDEPYGVAVDGAGNVYVADNENSAVEEIPYSGGSYGTPVTLGGGFYSPWAVAVDGAGNVYVADTDNQTITKIELTIDFGAANVGVATPVSQSVAFSVDTDGTFGSPVVLTGGAPNLDFSLGSGSTCTGALNSGSTCNVVVNFSPTAAGPRSGAVELVSATGAVLATAYLKGTGIGPQVVYPSNTATASLGSGFNHPEGVAVDGAGNVYVTDSGNSAVKKIPYSGGSYGTPVTLGSGFVGPFGVAVDGAGNVFFSDGLGYWVKEIPYSDGSYGAPVTLASGFGRASQIAVDSAGNVYVADSGNSAVAKIPYSGGSYGTPVTLGSGFNLPWGVAVDGAGNVYVADLSGAVKEIPYSGGSYGAPVTLGSGFNLPYGVAVDGAGNVYVADRGNNAVKEIPYSGGSYGTPVTLNSGLNQPWGIAVDGAGNVYVADTENQAIKKMALATPPALSFSTATVEGTTDTTDGPLAATVGNIGNAPLTFFSPTPSISTGFSLGTESTSCVQLPNMTLAAGSICTLTTTFAPVAPQSGPVTGSISLTDNNLNQAVAQQAIPLSGTAVSPLVISFVPGVGSQTYGTPIPSAALDATASLGGSPVAGRFAYTTTISGAANQPVVAGVTVLPVGSYTITATFTPSKAPAGVAPVTATAGYVVNQAKPVITWPAPAAITSGTALSGTQLDATTPVAGTFVYSPKLGVVLGTGANQTLSVQFTPADTVDYTSATASVPITVTAPLGTVSLGVANQTQTYQQYTNFVIGPNYTGSRVPTGTVTLYNNNVALTTLTLGGNGLAYYTASPFNVGANVLTASYSGDKNFPAGVSSPVTITVLPAPVNFQATCTGGTVWTVAYQCTVSISASTTLQPGGSITYSLDGAAPVVVALTSSKAAFTVASPAPGAHKVILTYAAQGNFAAGGPLTESFTTAQGATALKIAVSSSSPAAGSSISITGTASTPSSGVPTGTVTVYDNNTALGTAPIAANGSFAYPVTKIAKGSHSYYASYLGSTDYAAAKSATVSVTAH